MAIVVITLFSSVVLFTVAWSTGQPSAATERRCPPGSKPAGEGCIDNKPVRIIEKCPTAHQAVKFYAARIAYWYDRMGAVKGSVTRDRPGSCPRYLSHVLQRKAYGLRKEYARWVEYHYHWWKWLPAKYARVGRCETGGTAGATSAGNWFWDSGTYVSAFGIIRAAFPTWNGHNTPREQYEVAQSIQSRYGWGAWGCGGA